jgi:flagellar export protein FliJ
MTKSKRFEPIQQIAATAAVDLSRAMGEAGRRVAELEKQFEQLKTYRDDYTKSSAAGRATMDVVRLQNYRSFLDRLGEAMRQHTGKLEVARAEYDKRRLQWSQKRIEAESLGRVIDRFRKEERQVVEQREQREGDDAAMRISLTAQGDTELR